MFGVSLCFDFMEQYKLYRQLDLDSALRSFTTASKNGFIPATYARCIVLLKSGKDDLIDKGKKELHEFMWNRENFRFLDDCRKMFHRERRRLVLISFQRRGRPKFCQAHQREGQIIYLQCAGCCAEMEWVELYLP